jgi:ubiquinone/menaquinone biosynthesis C-methylase UbiE
MKLNLGAGEQKFDGFTSVDLYDPVADVKADICDLPFTSDSVDEIVAFQVIEHIPYQNSEMMFFEMYRVLKKGCTATIETPDIEYIAMKIVEDGMKYDWIISLVGEYYRPWDKDRFDDWENHAGAIHRNPWTFGRIKEMCEVIGFQVERIKPTQIEVDENMAVRLTK